MPSKGTSKHSKNRKVVCFFARPSSTKRLFKFDRQLLTLILGENILRPMGSPPNTHGWKMVLKRLTQTSWLKVEKVSLSSLLKRIRKKNTKTPETVQKSFSKWYCYRIKKKARTSPIRMRTAFYGRFHVAETQQPVQVGKHPNLHGTKTLGLLGSTKLKYSKIDRLALPADFQGTHAWQFHRVHQPTASPASSKTTFENALFCSCQSAAKILTVDLPILTLSINTACFSLDYWGQTNDDELN